MCIIGFRRNSVVMLSENVGEAKETGYFCLAMDKIGMNYSSDSMFCYAQTALISFVCSLLNSQKSARKNHLLRSQQVA